MGTRLRTARKLLLGREIEQMLAKAGVSQSEAAAILETSQSRIAMLIGGSSAITVGDLERLATALGFTDPGYRQTLQELRRESHKRGFWSTGFRRAYIEDLRLLVDLEAHASLLRVTEAEIVPGLLQCESYIRALHETDDAEDDDPDRVTVEDSVRARLARQEILHSADPPRLQAILSESCLRRAYGGHTTMLEQLEYLLEQSHRPNLLIQVLPFTITTHGAGMEDRFTVVRVPSPGIAGDLDIVVAESQGDIRYIDDKAAVAARETVWARLSAAALGADDTRDFIGRVARSFRRKTVTVP
ncbi:transcriptional regulator with XRE-family HTH domain [Nocardia transvalensis]|uniref:Transcriptional regulator with XRE-family HTH domain n=1 Tax=Nocardia transvalensis TaxID=37333 RepID=A0A7W9PJL5_9NOCA|nr:helix-turn-helix transcriptional regulator [Nocardia transvalensis]MBB5917381.1 transcriptional regulator with XRE-family HTH domain [Nocardia transvalensis]